MSTRSYICYEKSNGDIEAIYCHSDGYIEYVGRILQKYYKDEDKIKYLISLGNLSSLGKKPAPNPKRLHSFNGPKQRDIVVAYHRDRGDDLRIAQYKNRAELEKDLKDSWVEYVYLYSSKEHKWYVTDTYSDEYKWYSLKGKVAEAERNMALEEKKREQELKEKGLEDPVKVCRRNFKVTYFSDQGYEIGPNYSQIPTGEVVIEPKTKRGMQMLVKLLPDSMQKDSVTDLSMYGIVNTWGMMNPLISNVKVGCRSEAGENRYYNVEDVPQELVQGIYELWIDAVDAEEEKQV